MISKESKEGFRQKIAGFAIEEEDSPDVYREISSRIVCFLARHYNRDVLDPKAIWQRIESAIKTGLAKSSDNPEVFLSSMLEHVKAEIGRAVSDDEFTELLSVFSHTDANWMKGFNSYLMTATYAAMVIGRARWEEEKKGGRR